MADADFLASQKLTAAALNAEFNKTRVRRQQVDQTVNNSTTLINSNYLSFSVEASKKYILESAIMYQAAAAADFKFNLSLPSGSSLIIGTWTSLVTAAAVDSTIAHDAIATQPWPMGALTGVTMTSRPTGTISIGGTPGTAVVQFAQNTVNASNCTLVTGSWMRLTEVD